MATIKITARDSSTAMEEVSKKLGADAFILSTTSKEDGVEIEATNDPIELKKFSEQPRKKFSNLMKKQLGNVAEFPMIKASPKVLSDVTSYNEVEQKLAEDNISQLNENIRNLMDDIRGMFITGSGGLGVEIGESTFVKLEQSGFKTSVIKALSPSFNGLSFERGRNAFMKALAKSLTAPRSENTLNRITFINGCSGSGKTTLTAKMSATRHDEEEQNITVAKLGYEGEPLDDALRSHARMLNMPILRLSPENFAETLCSVKGKVFIDVSLEPSDGVAAILNVTNFLSSDEISSILAIPGGASSSFISRQAELFKGLNPKLTLTKLDECDLTSTEISEFFLNTMKIHYLTGSKSIVDTVSPCDSDILTQYLIENC